MDSSALICRRLLHGSWYQLVFYVEIRLKKLNETNILTLQMCILLSLLLNVTKATTLLHMKLIRNKIKNSLNVSNHFTTS